MKILPIIILLLFLVNLTSHAQKEYSLENLEKASQEEIDVYLSKALKLQKSGKTTTKVGVSTFGVSILGIIALNVFIEDPGMVPLIFIPPALAGLGTTAVGIPIKIAGKKRVERINSVRGTAFFDAIIELKPCVHYNLAAQKYQPGITFRIIF